MAEDRGTTDRDDVRRGLKELEARARQNVARMLASPKPPGVIGISLPKREMGNVRDAWSQVMWIINTAKGERVSMIADFRNGYDRAISWILGQLRTVPNLEMVLMLDGDIRPEIDLREAIAIARQSLQAGYGAVMSPVASQSLRVMVWPIGEKSKTEPYDVALGAITNFGFMSAEALLSLEPVGQFGDVDGKQWPAYIEERIENGTGDAHLCKRLGEVGWKLRADPRLLCSHRKDAYIQSDRPRTKIEVE